MTSRERVFIVGGLIVAIAIILGTKPLLSRIYDVPEWLPESSDFRFGPDAGPSIGMIPFHGKLRGAVELRIRDGLLYDDKDRVIPSEQIRPYIEELCRAKPDRTVVLRASRTEKLGGIIAIVNRAREASPGRVVLMHDGRR